MQPPAELVSLLTNPIVLENYFLPQWYPEADELEDFQDGYKYNSVTGETLTGTKPGDFNPDWWVIARSYAADCYFIDAREQEAGFPVYFAFAATGSWEPIRVADSLEAFTALLLELKELEASSANRQQAIASRFNLDTPFWHEIHAEYE